MSIKEERPPGPNAAATAMSLHERVKRVYGADWEEGLIEGQVLTSFGRRLLEERQDQKQQLQKILMEQQLLLKQPPTLPPQQPPTLAQQAALGQQAAMRRPVLAPVAGVEGMYTPPKKNPNEEPALQMTLETAHAFWLVRWGSDWVQLPAYAGSAGEMDWQLLADRLGRMKLLESMRGYFRLVPWK